jgi:hypothetical protein
MRDYCDDARRAPEAGAAGCGAPAGTRCGERRLISVTVGVSMPPMTPRARRAVPSARASATEDRPRQLQHAHATNA